MTPRDGVGRRVYHIPEKWSIRLGRGRLKSICHTPTDRFVLVLENLTGDSHKTVILLRTSGKSWTSVSVDMDGQAVQEIVLDGKGSEHEQDI